MKIYNAIENLDTIWYSNLGQICSQIYAYKTDFVESNLDQNLILASAARPRCRYPPAAASRLPPAAASRQILIRLLCQCAQAIDISEIIRGSLFRNFNPQTSVLLTLFVDRRVGRALF